MSRPGHPGLIFKKRGTRLGRAGTAAIAAGLAPDSRHVLTPWPSGASRRELQRGQRLLALQRAREQWWQSPTLWSMVGGFRHPQLMHVDACYERKCLVY